MPAQDDNEKWDTGIDWKDADGRGGSGSGRVSGALARIFGDGENPLAWGLPVFRARGILVKVHLFFIVFIVAKLIHAALPSGPGFEYIAWMMGAFFVLVLVHEFGHCFACRRVGGEADEIMMWPLGGLASCRPPHHWRADLATTLGGPAVNVALLPVFAAGVWLATGDWRSVVFNPFDPGLALGGLFVRGGNAQPTWLIGLWSLHYANVVLAAFNLLVPMFPMDAGRIVQALVWRKGGHKKSMEIATLVGLISAGVLASIGLVARGGGGTTLLALAVFGGLVCYTERRRMKFLGHAGLAGEDFPLSPPEPPEPAADEPSRAERKRADKAEAEQGEVDRVLAKISSGGMEALTPAERRTLSRATKRSQQKS